MILPPLSDLKLFFFWKSLFTDVLSIKYKEKTILYGKLLRQDMLFIFLMK